MTAGIDAEGCRVGAGQTPMTLGQWQSGPAWSTIKVPLVIAALREQRPPVVTDAMTAAITESDNAAAESIWARLGDPATAAHKVDDILRQTGDPTNVQSQKVRPEFSAFGQTDWALVDQARFISVAMCDRANAPIFALMGRVQPDQSWGIGSVPGSRFKGGWGPSPTGSYLVRQMGVLAAPNGLIAVALAAPLVATWLSRAALLTGPAVGTPRRRLSSPVLFKFLTIATNALAIGMMVSPPAQNSPTSWLTTGSTRSNALVPGRKPGIRVK